jgi:hypothetical protein
MAKVSRADYVTGMDIVINVLIVVAMAGVLVSLGLGLYSVARGGDYARANSNKFMRWRVGTQFAAVILLTIGFAYKCAH